MCLRCSGSRSVRKDGLSLQLWDRLWQGCAEAVQGLLISSVIPQDVSLFGFGLVSYRCESGPFILLLISNFCWWFFVPIFFSFLFFSRLSWLENSGVGFSLDYPTISLHAVSRDLNAYPWEHLYVMVNARFEGKPHQCNPFLKKGTNSSL